MEHLFTSESIISFLVLVVLEVVLGIDNVIFVSIILNRLKSVKEQKRARRITKKGTPYLDDNRHYFPLFVVDGPQLAIGSKR